MPVGYISYFVLPAVIGAWLGRWLGAKFDWRRPTALLTVELVVGFLWAFPLQRDSGDPARSLLLRTCDPQTCALWEGTKRQYPLYDALAIGVQTMVFTSMSEGRIPKAGLSSTHGPI